MIPTPANCRMTVVQGWSLRRIFMASSSFAVDGCWLELTVGVGEYSVGNSVCGRARIGPRRGRVARFLLIGGERSFVQDPGFGFRQLADTAIRALSPPSTTRRLPCRQSTGSAISWWRQA